MPSNEGRRGRPTSDLSAATQRVLPSTETSRSRMRTLTSSTRVCSVPVGRGDVLCADVPAGIWPRANSSSRSASPDDGMLMAGTAGARGALRVCQGV